MEARNIGQKIKRRILIIFGLQDVLQHQVELERRVIDIERLVQVGIDVHLKSSSWAVFCINGKAEYVRFVELDCKSLQELRMMIRKFEKLYGRNAIRIDKPPFIEPLRTL